MSSEDAIKEQEFISSLKADTGRNLAEWMLAIDGCTAVERNDIIDWLRQAGFNFDKASWLERIHNNDGQPIYADVVITTPKQKTLPQRSEGLKKSTAQKQSATNVVSLERPAKAEPNSATDSASPAAIIPFRQSPASDDAAANPEKTTTPPQAATPTHANDPTQQDEALQKLLASAKAYRPLAQHLLSAVERAVPGAAFDVTAKTIAIGKPDVFGILGVSAKGLTLALALEPEMEGPPLSKTKFPTPNLKVPAKYSQVPFTHLGFFDDARQVNNVLEKLIIQACQQVNGHI